MNKYLAIIEVAQDEFVTKRYLVNYLNIGYSTELRLHDISINNIDCLKTCIVYLDNEVKVLKKYHPDIIILPYESRIDLFKKQLLKYDLDVFNTRN